MIKSQYINQVRLLLRVLPYIAKEKVFALKGGTAINLFYRNMPRLSVDIDLVYIPIEDYETALKNINDAFDRIAAAIKKKPQTQAQRIAGGGNQDTRIEVRDGHASIKIETSPVTRGTVCPTKMMQVQDAVDDKFGFAEMQVVAFEDLYAGKMVAALDRKHARDLYDIKLLYDDAEMTEKLFRVFMVYVACSRRPMHEILTSSALSNIPSYHKFDGMTAETVTEAELISAHTKLCEDVKKRLTKDMIKFLLSLHDAEPDFELIGLPQAAKLPAVKWKCENLEKLRNNNPKKHSEQRMEIEKLEHDGN